MKGFDRVLNQHFQTLPWLQKLKNITSTNNDLRNVHTKKLMFL